MKKNQAAASTEQAKQIRSCQKKTTIGGQALIEGLMMIGPTKKAMAVRKADGSIHLEQLPMTKFTGAANMPFIRGSVRMFRQLVSGTSALMKSAEFVEEETAAGETAEGEAKPDPKPKSKFDLFLEKHSNLLLYVSATLGILFSVVLFILLPNFITSFIQDLTGLNRLRSAGDTILLSLIEGLIRIILFVGYLALASKMKDIKRVWMYHGAEHKAIACYEDRKELTVDNVRNYSRFHPRCGTAFMFVVIIVSIIVFAFVGWWGRWINLLIR